MKKYLRITLLIFILSFLLCACGTADTYEVLSVKNGYLTGYSEDITIGEVIDSFLENPKWEYFESTNGEDIVECTGGCLYNGEDVTARVQFESVDDETFRIYALGFNDMSQPDSVVKAFFDKVYEDYIGDSAASGASRSETNYDEANAMLNSDFSIRDKFGGAEEYLSMYRLDIDILNDKMLDGLSQTEVRQLLNALYARQGYTFTTEDNQRFFDRMEWYHPDDSTMEQCEAFFGSEETANKEFLANYEKKMGWR